MLHPCRRFLPQLYSASYCRRLDRWFVLHLRTHPVQVEAAETDHGQTTAASETRQPSPSPEDLMSPCQSAVPQPRSLLWTLRPVPPPAGCSPSSPVRRSLRIP